jgi:hypothetical protein
MAWLVRGPGIAVTDVAGAFSSKGFDAVTLAEEDA